MIKNFKQFINENINSQHNTISSIKNLLNINWENNITGYKSLTSALYFWNTDALCNHLISGDYYLKFNNSTGNLFFGNHSTHKILGFYEGIENISIVNHLGLNAILKKLKIYHGTSGAASHIASNVSSNAIIISNPNKTTTIVGNFQRYPYNLKYMSGDMKNLIEEICANLKTQQFGPKKGGYNILNVADEIITNWDFFWDDFNEPWLQYAINRNDNIYTASDPLDKEILFKNTTNVADITNPLDLYKFFENPDNNIYLTGFGKEIKLLIDNGYLYNYKNKSFSKS